MMAKALEANGAKVYIVGRRLEKLKEAAAQAKHGHLIPLQGDVTSQCSLSQIVSHITAEVGYINLLIANSGIMGPMYPELAKEDYTIEQLQENLWKTPMDEYTEAFAVNVTGVLYTTIAFLKLLDLGNQERNMDQRSQVIVTSSMGAFFRSIEVPGTAYVTSKAAVNHLIKSLAASLAKFEIRVNGIAPGIFLSDMNRDIFTGVDISADNAFPREQYAAGRGGREEEMAGTTLYLASKAGAFCSGSILLLDGGQLGYMKGSTY